MPATLMVMTYNQAEYVAASVASAFAQDYPGPLEILISDDASTDGTIPILRQLVADYDGPHSVRLNVNEQNLGLIPHLHKIFAMAREDFIVCMAGDDVSRTDRVGKLAEIQARTNALLVHSAFSAIDTRGDLLPDFQVRTLFSSDWTLEQASISDALFVGATAAYHRDVFQIFGPILFPDAFEDLVLGFRAALCDRLAHCDEPLVSYRIASALSQGSNSRTSRFLRAMRTMVAVAQQRRLDCLAQGISDSSPIVLGLDRMIRQDRIRQSEVTAAQCSLR